jgi:nitrogen regulatory protein P-II 1
MAKWLSDKGAIKMAWKKIEAIIRGEKIEDVRVTLEKAGFIGMTVTEVKGRGAQKGISLEWRAGEYRVEFLPKLKIELVIDEFDAGRAIKAIEEAAITGKAGDGKIFVSTIDNIIKIRTGERGEKAL